VSSACRLHFAGFLLGLFFDSDVGGSTLPRNVIELSPHYTALRPKIQHYPLGGSFKNSTNIAKHRAQYDYMIHKCVTLCSEMCDLLRVCSEMYDLVSRTIRVST
jgi:hypothetical protein